MTFGPGAAVWERFGHNGIWIVDNELGVDRIYDWGRFSFGDGFVSRFLKGYLRYWMGSAPSWAYFQTYREVDRSIWVQELALDARARRRLLASLQELDTDARRFYDYNYYTDNCSTRVRDALDEAAGGALARLLQATPATGNYRSHTQRLTAVDVALNAGLLLAIGPRVDAPATAWQESFIPMALRAHVRAAEVARPDGSIEPLVRREWTIHQSTAVAPPEAPPSLIPKLLALGLGLAALIALLGSRAGAARAGWSRRGLALVVGGWGLLAGLLGTIILGLWLGTEHVFTYGNENVVQMTPLSLGLAILGPIAILRGRATRLVAGLSAAVAALSAIGFFAQVLPGLDQVNGAIVALALPVHLATAWALRGGAAYGRPRAAPRDAAGGALEGG
ncbi:MAG: DUF4105 domain-containing protein [Gemmatimonadota bacterium]